jgi:hypothetical protein
VFWTWWLGDLAGALVVVTNLRRSRAAGFDPPWWSRSIRFG